MARSPCDFAKIVLAIGRYNCYTTTSQTETNVTTALQKLKDLWVAGEFRRALKLAASWPRLGNHKTPIERGWAAISNPSFYRQLGKNPYALYHTGLRAVADRYNLPLPHQQRTITFLNLEN